MVTKFTGFSFLMLGVCALAACSMPNSLPRGYTYHSHAYKSPNPPPSPKFTQAQRAVMGPEQANQFRMAMYEMVEKLTDRAGLPPKPVYVLRPDSMTPFYANMDNDLRESLRHLGYRLADSPDGAYVMAYSAIVADAAKVTDDAAPNTRMMLYVFDGAGEDAKLLTQQEGEYFIKGAETLNISGGSFSGSGQMVPTIEGFDYN